MGKVIKGPWPEVSHQDEHREMFNNLVKIVSEFNYFLLSNDTPLPKDENGDLDLTQIPINLLLNWTALQAQKVTHSHEEEDKKDGQL